MHDQPDLSDSTLTIFHKSFILLTWVYQYDKNISAFGCGAAGIVGSGYDVVRSTRSEMIENIPTPLVSFAGSGVAGFFMGMFLRRVLKFLVIIIGSFLGAVFLVIQWMQARQYIQGQVDWNRVGNDTLALFQSLSAQVSS